jgi:hypothetical protein
MGVIMGFFKGKMVEAEELKGHYPISILFIKNKKKKYPIFIPLNKVLGGAISIWSHTTLKKIYM